MDSLMNNSLVGKNIAKFRKLRDLKASEVAERLGLKEGAYTKYERGETAITLDLLQNVADVLEVDPLQILMTSTGNFMENVHNSPYINWIGGNYQATNDQQTDLIIKLMENIVTSNDRFAALSERLIQILEKK